MGAWEWPYYEETFEPETEEEKKRKEERHDAKVWDVEDKYQRL